MSIKKWIKVWFLMLAVIPVIAFINYYIDPFWTFSHSHSLNHIQKPFNERQQKTNNIYFNGFDKYDGILIGSSRATYVNQNHFLNMNIYNYAFNSSRPIEFKGYIDFAKEMKGTDLKYIVIGADFFGTKKPSIVKSQIADIYVKNVKSFAYRYKTMLSSTSFIESIKNIVYSIKGESRVYYTRGNLKYKRDISDKKRLSKYIQNIKIRTNDFLDEKYVYDNNYITTMQEIKKSNPNTKISIYTSPIHANLLLSLLKNNPKRVADFQRWLRELVEVFGEVHHFMDINSVTTKLKNYPDAEHFYENVGKFIANKIANKNTEEIPSDFGTILNATNIDSYLISFKNRVQKHKLDIKKHTY